MRKKLLSMVMAGTLALSFTACGGSSSGETEKSTDTSKVEETSSGDTQAVSADSGNKKTITVWVEKIFSDDANTKMEERLKEYGKEKNVTVNCEMVAATDFVTKLNAAIEAGQSVPDIISADTTKVLNYYPNIPCNDVTDLVDQIDEERPYLQASYEGTKIDDKYYYVPFYSSSTLMFVRKDKLEEAGITEMPTTWDEVFKDAEKVSDPDNDFYGLAIGCDFEAEAIPDNNPELLIKKVKDVDIVIATMEPWNETTLGAVKGKVKFIQKYGTGVDSVDLKAAGKNGIPVANIPGANAPAVAEVAMMHILNLGRRFTNCVEGCREGIWPSTITGNELDGKIVGLAGYGRVAKNLARMISGFSVKLLAYDPFVKEAVPGQDITFVDTLEELFERSDIVSLHMPFMPSTARIINKSLFERMKPHAYLVNTCRGGVIDEADLIEALKTGKLAGAGLDVLTEEPPKADQPLMHMDNVYITSHMGAASLESEYRSQVIIADNIKEFLEGKLPKSVRNKEFLV